MFRLGIVDLDSSHCVEFTKRFHHAGVSGDQYVHGARVVLAVPGTSEMSPERIPLHAKVMTDLGVKLVDSPDRLLGQVDGVLVLSVCGQSHWQGARKFLEAGVPTFVDKPFACSWEDAQEMMDLAAAKGAMLWSSSAMRFAEEVLAVTAKDSRYGEVNGAMAFGPAIRAAGNPGLLHYGIHAAELLFTLMGPDCQSVSCLHEADADLVSARFSDGRLATLRGTRAGNRAYGFTAFCEAGVVHQLVSTRFAYRNLCQAIVQSLETRQPAVPIETTLKLMRFLLAANDNAQTGGQWRSLEE
jgi:predicted dehydrogenase